MTFTRKWHLERLSNLPLAERKLFFNALIKPILLYGSWAWTTATEENVKRVFKLQKWEARVILDANIRDRSEDLFRRLDWLPFKDEANLQKRSLIFWRIRNEDNCPDYTTKLLPRNSDLRSDSRATTTYKNAETLPRKNDHSCFKPLPITGLWDIILTFLLPPIQSCSSKFWVWSCTASNFDKGWRGDHF